MSINTTTEHGSIELDVTVYEHPLPANWDVMTDLDKEQWTREKIYETRMHSELDEETFLKRVSFENWLLIEIGKLLIRVAAGPFGPFIPFP